MGSEFIILKLKPQISTRALLRTKHGFRIAVGPVRSIEVLKLANAKWWFGGTLVRWGMRKGLEEVIAQLFSTYSTIMFDKIDQNSMFVKRKSRTHVFFFTQIILLGVSKGTY
ncbi:hypothetical protein ACJX0J_015580 [Zea mays]